MLLLERSRANTLALPSYSPVTAAVAPELARAFEAACDFPSPAARARLHDVTVALVERLKDDAVPPERVLIALKTAIARYGRTHLLPSLNDGGDGRTCHGEVYRLLFAWFLTSYFTATTPTPRRARTF